MKKVKDLKRWVELYNEVHAAAEETQNAFEFYKEEIVTEEEVDKAYAHAKALIEDLELRNMLRNEEDHMDAVLKIVAGAGGTEAQDWADMLFRMYQRWCERRGYTYSISNFQEAIPWALKQPRLRFTEIWPMAI